MIKMLCGVICLLLLQGMEVAVGAEPATRAAGVELLEGYPQGSVAEAIKLEGVPNFYRVSLTLYRSAQPTAEGMKNLQGMGIRTVINLRAFHSDKDEIGAAPLQQVNIDMKAWHAEEEDVVRFLKVVTDPQRQPVLVHCQHGADRTGTMCAVYRIVVQGWTREDAIREMTQGDFGYHKVFANLPEYLEKLDVQELRKKAGISDDKGAVPAGGAVR